MLFPLPWRKLVPSATVVLAGSSSFVSHREPARCTSSMPTLMSAGSGNPGRASRAVPALRLSNGFRPFLLRLTSSWRLRGGPQCRNCQVFQQDRWSIYALSPTSCWSSRLLAVNPSQTCQRDRHCPGVWHVRYPLLPRPFQSIVYWRVCPRIAPELPRKTRKLGLTDRVLPQKPPRPYARGHFRQSFHQRFLSRGGCSGYHQLDNSYS